MLSTMTIGDTPSSHRFFQQSRRLTYVATNEFIEALFNELERYPRDMMYSIAFTLAYYSTNQKKDVYTVNSELFDLLDDLMCETDTLTARELLSSRVIDYTSFCQTIDAYDQLVYSDGRYDSISRKFKEAFDRARATYLERKGDFGNSSGSGEIVRVTSTEADEIINVLREISASTRLPLPVNMNASIVERQLISPTATNDIEYTISDSSFDDSAYTRRWNVIETYLRYAPSFYRWRSLAATRAQLRERRGIDIRPIFLPLATIWQGGTSQLLWILLHTISALCVARRGLYVKRWAVLLRNAEYYIWCIQCKNHWIQHRGREYFTWLENEIRCENDAQRRDSRVFAVDVILARIHNVVTSNNAIGRALTDHTLARIIVDYRDFADIALLRRRDVLTDLSEYQTIDDQDPWKPMYRDDAMSQSLLLDRLVRAVDPKPILGCI